MAADHDAAREGRDDAAVGVVEAHARVLALNAPVRAVVVAAPVDSLRRRHLRSVVARPNAGEEQRARIVSLS